MDTMYQLTARMEQSLERYLVQYHELFDAQGCKAWQLEELIVNAIKSDTHAQHHPMWKETGHDDQADITVRTNGTQHLLQIKSGQFKDNKLKLSGHRLGRFQGNLGDITDYLNIGHANILAVPHDKWEDGRGRHHSYRIFYLPIKRLQGLSPHAWEQHGKQYRQFNKHGVGFSLHPSMSWQIWWKIPFACLTPGRVMNIR